MTRKTPTELRLITGNAGKRKLPKREPKPPSSRPEPPASLSATAQAEWRRVVGRLADLGLMTDLDVVALSAYCDAVGDWVSARRAFALELEAERSAAVVQLPSGIRRPSPWLRIIRDARNDAVRFAAELGMTPAGRAGLDVQVGPLDPRDPPPRGPEGKPKADYYS